MLSMVMVLTWSTRIVSTKRRLGLVRGLRRSIRRVACKREAYFILNYTVVKTRAKKAHLKIEACQSLKLAVLVSNVSWYIQPNMQLDLCFYVSFISV